MSATGRKRHPVKPEWCRVLFSRWGSGTMHGQLPRSHNISLFCSQRRIPNGRSQKCCMSWAQFSRNCISRIKPFRSIAMVLWPAKWLSSVFGPLSCFQTWGACIPLGPWLMLSGHPNITMVEEIQTPLKEDDSGLLANFFYFGAGKLHSAPPPALQNRNWRPGWPLMQHWKKNK